MRALFFLFLILIASVVLPMFTIFFVSRWVKAERHKFRHAAATVALLTLLSIATVGVGYAFHGMEDNPLAVGVGQLAICLVASFWIVRYVHKVNVPRGLAITGALVGVNIGLALFVFGLVRPFVFEAFRTPTNSMAPELMGEHLTARCPNCGGRLVVSPPVPNEPPGDSYFAICQDCFKVANVRKTKITGSGTYDRFMVDKRATPARWDIATFHFKNQIYVKRVVGLPGDTIDFEGGKLRVNNVVAVPPGNLAKLEWADGPTLVGRSHSPVVLGKDMYYVMGDFGLDSYDSRYFGPIAGKDLVGVVTSIYWPLSRFQVLQ